MKRFVITAMALSAGLVFGAASAQAGDIAGNGAHQVSSYNAGDAATGIAASLHNLGSFSRNNVLTGSTSEICVFCHTPHWTNQTSGITPLWNRGTSAATYSAYGTTIGGTTIADSDIGSATLACLSCHDGVTTFDNLVNAPGSSGITFATGTYNVLGVARGWVFGTRTSPTMGSSTAGDGSQATGGQRLKIGSDLSNDHPLSVVYYPDRAGLRPTNTVIATIDLTSDLAASATIAGNLTQNKWDVKGYISTDATIANLLRNGKVECTSCHDPHFKNQSWDEVEASTTETTANADGLFLRRVGGNSGSGVCRTCHNK